MRNAKSPEGALYANEGLSLSDKSFKKSEKLNTKSK